jgi:decaprenyl-phosphate phosphoribosyltransferase
VFAAPVTAGVLLEPESLRATLLAFAAFCIVASGVYYVNDLADRDADRAHHSKRHRPIASGQIRASTAAVVAAALLAGGVVVAFLSGPGVGAILLGYIALTLSYTAVLRNIVLLDLAAIAGGFMLRAIAGGIAVGVPLSSWFLIVATFGSFFMAAGRRHAEYVRLGKGGEAHRPVLRQYSEPYLRYLQYSASTVTITGYALWAFEGAPHVTVWSGLSIIPFVIGIFRYGLLLDSGQGETPEDVVLRDPPLLILGCLWLVFVVAGIYAA